jgi:hypothetical protein
MKDKSNMCKDSQDCQYVFDISLEGGSCSVDLSLCRAMPQDSRLCSAIETNEIANDALCDGIDAINFMAIVNFMKTLEQEADDRTSDAIVYTAFEL